MGYSKWIIHSVLLFTVPSIALHPQADLSVDTVQNHATVQEPPQTGSLLSYDDILNLISDLEDGELEKRCSQADLEKINHFLANLAKQGVLPNETEEESVIEDDIQELLLSEDNPYEYSFFFGQGNDYVIVPALFYSHGRILLCKSWIHKKWDQTKKFVKKHKKAIIIGAAVVVAAVVVGVVVASAAGAAAAGAAASESDKEEKKSATTDEQGLAPPSMPSNDLSSTMAAAGETPILKPALEEQISSFKENIAKEQFFQSSPHEESSLGENGRVLGSLFAHDSFKNLTRQFSDQPQLAEEFRHLPSLDFGHQEIDRQFSTDYAPLYANPNFDADFNALSYQLRGEKALASGHLYQAVHDLGKAIELEPTNPLPYLERGVAHFGLGQYDYSLEDYHKYTSQTQKTHPLSIPDFSLGFAKGLPKGIYDSGEGLFLFLSDLVRHPVHTGEQMWDALTLLGNLARTEQWGALSEVLAPEVHQLVKEWESLPSDVRGELAGYAFGKYGSDIIIPGALAKAVSKGLQGAQELSAVHKGLQTAEQTLLLESVADLENGAKIGEVIQASQKTIVLGEELGFSAHEMAQLKQAGNLEGVVANTLEDIFKDPAMRESAATYKNAQDFLKPHAKKTMSEEQVRGYIHETGIPTFPRPKGIPENFLVMISDKGAGMLYVHPENTHISIRVMPGKSHSPFPYQQKPYVIQMESGKAIDKFGKRISPAAPEAHIPLEEFIYRN